MKKKGSGLSRKWNWSFSSLEGLEALSISGSRRGEQGRGQGKVLCRVTCDLPGPVTLFRERTGRTVSRGESSPILVTPQLLIVHLKTTTTTTKHDSGLYISYTSLANVSLPCKLIFTLILAQQ